MPTTMPKRPRTGDSGLKSITSSIESKPSRWSLGQFGRIGGTGNGGGMMIGSRLISSTSSPTHVQVGGGSQIDKSNSPSLSPCENGAFSGPPRKGRIGVYNDCSSNEHNELHHSPTQKHAYNNEQNIQSPSKVVPPANHQQPQYQAYNHQSKEEYAVQGPPLPNPYPLLENSTKMYSQSYAPSMATYEHANTIMPSMMEAYNSTPWIRSTKLDSKQSISSPTVEIVPAGFTKHSVKPTNNSVNRNAYMWAPDTMHESNMYSVQIDSDRLEEMNTQSTQESERYYQYDSTYNSNVSRPSRQASSQTSTSYSSDSFGADEESLKTEKARNQLQTTTNKAKGNDEVKRHHSSKFQIKPLHALNDYEPLVTLGTGTFGRVLLVRLRSGLRTDPSSYFALKVLNKCDVIRLKQVAHTNNERDILSKVYHPFIVNLFSTYQDEKNCYMLMEYVVGGEVFSHLRKARRFTADVTRFYISCLVLALAYLHSEKILYRDLKPENLLLDEEGYIKIADFGFAKSLRKQERTWTLCGTPEYLSPEVIQSQGQSFASDYWALGILMYEMICGFPPFYDKTPFGTYEKILNAKLVFPKHVDECSKDLIQQFLTRDVTKRLGNLSGGANDVIRHPWFEGVDWHALLQKRIPAPIIPVQFHAGDSGNFQKYDDFDITKMPALQNVDQNELVNIKNKFGSTSTPSPAHPSASLSSSEEYIQSQFVDF